MFQWTLAGILVVAAGVLMKWYVSPQKIVVTPPGAVIFNPAPSTGSVTFLGDITGNPANNYWNITTQINDIPSGFIQSQSSFAGVNAPPTLLYGVMSSK
jgi:hypothetical protein